MDTATEASRIIDGTNEAELDRFLRVLANPIRRYLFQELFQERDTVVSIDKLCDAIAADIDGEITKKRITNRASPHPSADAFRGWHRRCGSGTGTSLVSRWAPYRNATTVRTVQRSGVISRNRVQSFSSCTAGDWLDHSLHK